MAHHHKQRIFHCPLPLVLSLTPVCQECITTSRHHDITDTTETELVVKHHDIACVEDGR